MKDFKIYALTPHDSPRDIRYIGLTRQDLKARLRVHRNAALRLKHHAACWIRSCSRNVDIVLLEDGLTEKEAISKEQEYILCCKQAGIKLTNGNNGGNKYTDPAKVSAGKLKSSYRHSEEYREKQKAVWRNLTKEEKSEKIRILTEARMANKKPLTEEQRHRASIARKGKKLSPEHKAKISIANTGKKRSREVVERHRVFLTGRKHSRESLEKRAENSVYNIPTSQYTKEGEYIQTWPSVIKAGEALNLNNKLIRMLCEGRSPSTTCGGFKWLYSGTPEQHRELTEYKTKKGLPIKIVGSL